jgi:hypothetical protein
LSSAVSSEAVLYFAGNFSFAALGFSGSGSLAPVRITTLCFPGIAPIALAENFSS